MLTIMKMQNISVRIVQFVNGPLYMCVWCMHDINTWYIHVRMVYIHNILYM